MKKFTALMLAMLMVMALLAGCGASKPAADASTIKIGMTGPPYNDIAGVTKFFPPLGQSAVTDA